MPDEADQAQATEALWRMEALANRPSRRSGPGAPLVNGTPVCRECGKAIPPARLKAVPGCPLCVDCQAEADEP
jgi:phage/conjugal plasmid C-4 type zinc finger TraR family protein